MMRRPILMAVAGAALTVAAGPALRVQAAGYNQGGNNQGGQSVGGGSFVRPSAPSAPAHTGGGENMGGRLPARETYSPAREPSPSRSYSAPIVYPKTSVPTFVEPHRAPESNAVIEPFRPEGGRREPSGPTTAGGGFIKLPHEPGANTGATIPRTFPDHRAINSEPSVANGQKLARGLGAATAAVGLGGMPAIQHHLQQRGQNLQTWSASRDQAFDHWHQQNAARLTQFQQNRDTQWSQLRTHKPNLIRMAHDRGADWQNYRRDLWRFRYDRADEIRDRLRDGCDDLFTYDWWGRHHGRHFPLGGFSPWWWWNPCPWNTVIQFGGYGWGAPIYYDYDANVLMDDDVYIDGQDMGPSTAYAQQAIQLANPGYTVEDPTPPESSDQPGEWQPFGVFALTQEEKGDAIMFFQLAMSRDGLISGAFTNLLTGDSESVTGSIDRATQRAAWHVGSKTNTVYETGVANLTLPTAPVLIHFDTQSAQTWLLVRLASPDLPTAPTPVDATAPPPAP